MMFERLIDEKSVESDEKEVSGFGRFRGEVLFKKKKIVKKGSYNIANIMVNGYEIHNGTTKKRYKESENLFGTFIHGLFDSDAFRYRLFSKINYNYVGYNFKEYKEKSIKEFADHVDKHIDMNTVTRELNE